MASRPGYEYRYGVTWDGTAGDVELGQTVDIYIPEQRLSGIVMSVRVDWEDVIALQVKSSVRPVLFHASPAPVSPS